MTDVDIINNLKYFASPILILVFVLLMYVWNETGRTIKGMREYFNTTAKKALLGITMAVVIPCLLGIVLSVISASANASSYERNEYRYLTHTILFAGLEVPLYGNSFTCVDKGVNDRLTSNLGIYQQLVGIGDIDFHGYYLHHSCAVNADRETSDSIGVGLSWRIDWK